jgi:hypothetical protein
MSWRAVIVGKCDFAHILKYNLRNSDDDAFCTDTSGGPHAAHGPRV